jgi:two-component system sensor histidine kinase/response regulator
VTLINESNLIVNQNSSFPGILLKNKENHVTVEDNKPLFVDEEEFLLPEEPEEESATATEEVTPTSDTTWEVLIVDDEEDVHQLTRFVLDDYIYQGRKIKFLSAYSAQEAKQLFANHPNPAVILLDVVMETNDAGLKLVEYIREVQRNSFTRIILRTGQPGYAPEKQVILKYDINDYKNKTELTDQKLFTIITASLRAYSDLITIESYRQHLEAKVLERTVELRQKNEELMQANQKLIQLNKEKDEFLGIAAHDLKNPLSSIQSLAGFIKNSFDNLTKEKIIQYAHIIEVSSQKMFDLIKNLLDVNAIESGKMNLSFHPLDIRFLVQYVMKNYLETAKAKEIELEYHSSEEKCLVFIDQSAMLQVLDNLISNAVKYSPPHKRIELRVVKTANTVQCQIQDEGPGLSEIDHSKLFGKFVRLTPRPTKNEHSTGLGLFIVKKLVENLRGRVWCETELGKGATFIVEFPLSNG